jgi:hypothetical protein
MSHSNSTYTMKGKNSITGAGITRSVKHGCTAEELCFDYLQGYEFFFFSSSQNLDRL